MHGRAAAAGCNLGSGSNMTRIREHGSMAWQPLNHPLGALGMPMPMRGEPRSSAWRPWDSLSRAMMSKTYWKLLGMRPRSSNGSSLPSMVWDLPVPVWPYAKIVPACVANCVHCVARLEHVCRQKHGVH